MTYAEVSDALRDFMLRAFALPAHLVRGEREPAMMYFRAVAQVSVDCLCFRGCDLPDALSPGDMLRCAAGEGVGYYAVVKRLQCLEATGHIWLWLDRLWPMFHADTSVFMIQSQRQEPAMSSDQATCPVCGGLHAHRLYCPHYVNDGPPRKLIVTLSDADVDRIADAVAGISLGLTDNAVDRIAEAVAAKLLGDGLAVYGVSPLRESYNSWQEAFAREGQKVVLEVEKPTAAALDAQMTREIDALDRARMHGNTIQGSGKAPILKNACPNHYVGLMGRCEACGGVE